MCVYLVCTVVINLRLTLNLNLSLQKHDSEQTIFAAPLAFG